MKYLQSVLKKFDGVATPMDNLLIRYFWDGLRLSIRIQLDEKNRNQNDEQMVVKQAMDVVTEAAWQSLLLMRESDVRC